MLAPHGSLRCAAARRLHVALAAALASIALVSPGPARAERAADGAALLGQAVAAYEDLRVEAALELLARAERRGGLSQPDLARLHLYRGLARAALGETGQAEESFRAALGVEPELEMPAGTSPVVRRQFEALRQEHGQGRAGGEGEGPEAGGGEGEGGGQPGAGEGGGEGGGQAGAGAGEGGEGGGALPEPEPAPRRLLVTWVGLGLTAAAFAGGAAAMVLAEVTRARLGSGEHVQSYADRLLADYELESRLGFGLLSAAVALGAATLLVWLGEREVPRALPGVAVTPSGAALVVSGPLAF